MKKYLQYFIAILVVLISLPTVTRTFASYNTSDNIPSNYINIGTPQDLIILSDGSIWYVDSQNFRVVKIDQSGNILRTVGRQGSDWGEFDSTLTGITNDNEGKMYILGEHRVYVLDENGAMIDKWGVMGSGASEFSVAEGIAYDVVTDSILITDANQHKVMSFSKDGSFNFKFGSLGSTNGKLNTPWGITTDSNGKIYVVDNNNHRVQVFNKTGQYLSKFGTEGIGDGQFTFPKDIDILTTGKIVVSSQNSQKIQVFNSNGTFFDSWGQQGNNIDQFEAPQYIALDTSNNVFVTDWMKKSIQKFSSTGTYISSIRNSGNTDGRLTDPYAVAYDSLGNLYVLDNGATDPRLQKFTNSGTYIGTLLTTEQLGLGSYHMRIVDDYIYITHGSGVKKYGLGGGLALQFGGGGTGNGEFDQARGIDVDSAGNIYVADYYNSRIQKFDSSGGYVTQFGGEGTDPGDTTNPVSLYIDSEDNIYVASNQFTPQARVQIFNTSGVYQSTVGAYGTGEGEHSDVLGGIVKDNAGNLYVTDTMNNRIIVYDNTNQYVTTFGSLGGGSSEFSEPAGLGYDTTNDTMVIADKLNHRVQYVAQGVRIFNLIPSSDVQRASDDQSLVNNYYDPADPGMDDVSAQMYFGDYIVADFDVDLTDDRDWSEVNTVTAPTEFKTIVENLDMGSAPGLTTTTNMYVPREAEQRAVFVCPGVSDLSEITFDCAGGYYKQETDPDVDVVTVDGNSYWKILEVTNSGIMGVFPVTHFDVQIDDTTVTTGSYVDVTVSALDTNNNVVEDYTGEINLSVDGLPDVVYTFTPEDKGTHTFVNEFKLDNPRDYVVIVYDTVDTDLGGESGTIKVSDPQNSTSGVVKPVYAAAGEEENTDTNNGQTDKPGQEVPVDSETNNPPVNQQDDPTDPKTVEKTNLSFLYWLVPLLLLVFFVSYRSINIGDNK